METSPCAQREFVPPVIREGGLEDERIVSCNLENSIVTISSRSAQGRGINTSWFSAGIEGNHVMMEKKPEQYIEIGKLFYIYSSVFTFYTWVKVQSKRTISPCITRMSSLIVRTHQGILRMDTSGWVYRGVDSSCVTVCCYIKSLSNISSWYSRSSLSFPTSYFSYILSVLSKHSWTPLILKHFWIDLSIRSPIPQSLLVAKNTSKRLSKTSVKIETTLIMTEDHLTS